MKLLTIEGKPTLESTIEGKPTLESTIEGKPTLESTLLKSVDWDGPCWRLPHALLVQDLVVSERINNDVPYFKKGGWSVAVSLLEYVVSQIQSFDKQQSLPGL